MKPLLLLCLMAIAVGGKAQLPQGFWNIDTTNKVVITTQPVYDTVPVLLLYSDTTLETVIIPIQSQHLITKQIWDGLSEWDKLNDSTWTIRLHGQSAYWMKGYEVREIIKEGYWVIKDWGISYLDEKRKPLSKNIIVWQSKNL